MTYGTILVEVTDDSGLEPRLRVARVLADRFDAALIGMHVMPPPFIPGSYGDATAYFGPDLIEAQRKANREIKERVSGMCGQAPSDYPELAEYLVRLGIDSISFSPDTVLRTTPTIVELEKKLGRKPRTTAA
jgi:hypothetical protein